MTLRMLLPCVASFSLLAAQEPEPSDAPDKVPSDFIRFVKVDDGGHLDTAITTYKKGAVELMLYGAVHIADLACYETLNDRFTTCDVLLYELVGPEDYRPSKDREERGFNLVSVLQQGLRNALELRFQLDEIDYSPANFVHADMTPKEFAASMAERGESVLSIMLNMMLSGMQAELTKAEQDAEPEESFDLVAAFRSGEGRHTMRMAFAGQLEEIEKLSSGGTGSGTLLQGRNEKCLQVLERELAAGRKRIGIYYGAAHLPHLEQRLVADMGFQKVGHEWLVAWDCTKRPDVKYDRALVMQRRQCKDELEQLAAAVRAFRRQRTIGETVTPAELAKAQYEGKPHEGRPLYAGPAQDPWGRDYVLRKRPTGVRWEAVSLGQDGTAGTADDIVAQEPRGR